MAVTSTHMSAVQSNIVKILVVDSGGSTSPVDIITIGQRWRLIYFGVFEEDIT